MSRYNQDYRQTLPRDVFLTTIAAVVTSRTKKHLFILQGTKIMSIIATKDSCRKSSPSFTEILVVNCNKRLWQEKFTVIYNPKLKKYKINGLFINTIIYVNIPSLSCTHAQTIQEQRKSDRNNPRWRNRCLCYTVYIFCCVTLINSKRFTT